MLKAREKKIQKKDDKNIYEYCVIQNFISELLVKYELNDVYN